MRFNNDRPIFSQIADMLVDEIIAGRLAGGSRILSARELASSLEVNPNTAARALQLLADGGIAMAERGSGYFVAADGAAKAREGRRTRFFEEALPAVFKSMDELGIGIADLVERYTARNGARIEERA